MHNPESVLEKETHKLLWDFERQTDHRISARRPDLIIINKKKKKKKKEKKKRIGRIMNFAVPADHRVKLKECEKNTEKNHRDLRRLAVTQTPVKDHQLKLMRKTLKEKYYYYYYYNK